MATSEDVESVIEYMEIGEVELRGQGLLEKNAGIIGGGFGFQGAAEGMLAAAAINALTTETWMETFLRISGVDFEVFFYIADATPQELRIRLSAVYTATKLPIGKPSAATRGEDVAGQLSQLAQLYQQDLLSAEEYVAAKNRLLKSGNAEIKD